MNTLGIMILLQSRIFRGRSMEKDLMLQFYNILPSPTIILNLRLPRGSPQPINSKGTGGVFEYSIPKGRESNQGKLDGVFLFKDILKDECVALTTPDQTHDIRNPCIVEQLNQIPVMTVQ